MNSSTALLTNQSSKVRTSFISVLFFTSILTMLIALLVGATSGKGEISGRPDKKGLVDVGSAALGAKNLKTASSHDSDYAAISANPSAEIQSAIQQNRARPVSLASADFDEDGLPDLVGGYDSDGRGVIALWRGRERVVVDQVSTPSKETIVTEAAFGEPTGIRSFASRNDFIGAGDFNADGHADIITASYGDNVLYYLLGDGRGQFLNRKKELPGKLNALITGDVNRPDGLPDLVIAISSSTGGRVLVFEGPNGAMDAQPETFNCSGDVNALTLGNLDHDQMKDIAVASGSELLLIHGRDRKVSLDTKQQTLVRDAMVEKRSLNSPLVALTSGKFSGEGQPDLAWLTEQGQLWVLSPPANYEEQTSKLAKWKARIANNENWTGVTSLSAGRFGSSVQDSLILLNAQSHRLSVLKRVTKHSNSLTEGISASGPAPMFTATSLADGQTSQAFLSLKINGDALDDLVFVQQGKLIPVATVSNPSAIITVNSSADTNNRDNFLTLREAILLANEELLKTALTAAEQQQVQGTPAPGLDEVRFAIAAGNAPVENAASGPAVERLLDLISTPSKVDVTALVSSLSTSTTVQSPSFTNQTPYQLPSTNNSRPHTIVAFNRLGRPALAVTNRPAIAGQPGDSVTVFYAKSTGGNFDGTFVDGVTYPLTNGAQAQRVVVGNLGQLNVPSLLVAAAGMHRVAVLLGKQADDTFQPAVYYQTDPSANPTFPEALTLGDFNNDGNLDIAVANYQSASVGILLGNSDGTFQNVVIYPEIATSGPEFIVTADFNGDGKLDLATCNTGNIVSNNKIMVLFGNGDGTFQTPQQHTTGVNPFFMVATDFNGDGKPDLATSNGHGVVNVLLNSGTGTFPTKTDLSAGTDPNSLSTADVNLDGFPDLVVASGGGNNVTVLLNNTNGTFQQPALNTTAVPGSGAYGITTGDFNVDGRPDIAVANNGNNTVGVLLNTTVDLCGFGLNPTSQLVNSPGGSLNVGVTANVGCSWSATSNASWIHSSATGSGNGTAAYTVDPNIGAARSGTLAIGGHLLTINQESGCSFSINPTVKNAVNGIDNGFVTVTCSAGDCAWTAKSNASWIQVVGANQQGVLSGIGDGVVNYNVASNSGGPARTGTITIAGQIFTVLQNAGGVCSYSISPISKGFGPTTGTGQISVTSPFGCDWTATSNNPGFITITSGATGTNNGTVTYSVSANGSGSPRAGTISITGGNTFTVTQGTTNTNLRSITLTSPLPQITDPITIDGWTQGGAGYTGPPLIEINGQNLASQNNLPTRDGLRITAGSSLIRGLAINRFTSATRDAAIRLSTNGNNVIEGCYIGPDANGTNAFAPANTNGLATGITIQSSSDNTIGGLTAPKRNLISGIDGSGISISNGATRNLIRGNYIGVDVTGNVRLTDAASNAYQRIGVYIQNAGGNTVGGTTVGAGNLISGNLDYGVFVQDESTNNLVQGNTIGTNVSGSAAVPNNNAGVFLYRPSGNATSADNTIGGTTPTARNLISGNEPYGVVVGNRATGSLVQGNYIGTNASGTAAIPNTYGVTVTQATGSTIGGDPVSAAGARNIVSGNKLTGIYLGFLNNGVAGGTGVTVLGNYIGTDSNGSNALGNSRDGVFVEVQSASDTVQFNRIAFNGNSGIRIPNVSDVPGTPAFRIPIVDNSIYANAALGIDLGEVGITPNDPLDADVGANLQQNFPELTSFVGNFSAPSVGGAENSKLQPNSPAARLLVQGILRSTPNAQFFIHWYFSTGSQCVANQMTSLPLNGERIPVVTDSNGDGPFTIPFNFPVGTVSGVINCQAKDADGNASEFSACLPVSAPTPQPNAILFSANNYSVSEAGTQLVVTVNRTDATAAATVDYGTSDSAGANNCSVNNSIASARCDYLTTNGTLQFGAGETSKVINIPVVDDAYSEGAETFTITLSNANGANLGSPSSATLTITDNDASTGANPIGTPGFFVNEHYVDFLNRQPDSSGLAFWTNEITSCGSDASCIQVKRINVSAAFFVSIEFQKTGYLVERVYKVSYGNAQGSSTFNGPHQLQVPIVRLNEFLSDTQAVGLGFAFGQPGADAKLEANTQQFFSGFVQRARFVTAFPANMTPAQFVDALNVNSGNALSTAERNQLVTDLTNGTKTRAQVLRSVAEDTDLERSESNRAFVLMQYFGYLRRNPNDPNDSDYTGYDFWLTKLNEFGGNYIQAEMVKAFLESTEYNRRFGP